jgi:transaldolase
MVMMTTKPKTANPLRQINRLGQSVWIDYIRRASLNNGEFAGFIENDGVTGVTSNPAIFEQAIAQSDDYTAPIRRLAVAGLPATQIYETLAVDDIRMAADMLRDVYYNTDGRDGYVSLEVSPHLANDTQGTIAEAIRLWKLIARPNAMIKIPGTHAGLPAITRAIALGINVNVTLLFTVSQYRDVAIAFFQGLEQRLAAGKSVDRIASVASFFLSRIDTAVDAQLEASNRPSARALLGKAAIASARLAYDEFRLFREGPRWHRLAEFGAMPQRLLWASTSTKNPAYEDTLYVESLIGPHTVNTLPLKTLHAYRDHGAPAVRLTDDLAESQRLVSALAREGIDLDRIGTELEREGLQLFVKPFERLMALIHQRIDETAVLAKTP